MVLRGWTPQDGTSILDPLSSLFDSGNKLQTTNHDFNRHNMICVSLGRTRHKMVMAEHRALAQRGAELVELRLDFLARDPDLTRLLPSRPTPVVVTCRTKKDKGRWFGSEEQRLTLLRAAIVAGVEYVDLEEETAPLIRRYGKTKRIISHHDFDETPQNIEEIHARLCKLDPDIVKIVTMANAPYDNIRMLKLVASAKVPTVAFCMGELGTISRILTGRYGAPFTYATFSPDRELAPGQLPFEDMKNIYRYDQITRDTELFGVLGDPVAHSLSPLIHNTAFANEAMDRVYVPFRIPADTLDFTLQQYEWLGVRGYSVTIPHKEAVVSFAQHHDPSVQEIGAANTLLREGEGLWNAINTDYSAALASVHVGLQETEGMGASLEGKRVLIMGAGGVARAVGRAMVRSGAIVAIANRTKQRSVTLAAELGCQQILWDARASHYADVLINCTSVGMHPNVDESPFAENWLREGLLVFDTVYTPEQTLLIKTARDRGCHTVTGVEMFVRQAAMQFELFTGNAAPIDFMRETIRRGLSSAK
jgi:3-dehydroquinate dehydratase/shikimate dehydrogenase